MKFFGKLTFQIISAVRDKTTKHEHNFYTYSSEKKKWITQQTFSMVYNQK